MSENNDSDSGGGVGLFGLMFVVFVALKLTGHIAWSWLWVSAVMWMPLSAALALLAFVSAVKQWELWRLKRALKRFSGRKRE